MGERASEVGRWRARGPHFLLITIQSHVSLLGLSERVHESDHAEKVRAENSERSDARTTTAVVALKQVAMVVYRLS